MMTPRLVRVWPGVEIRSAGRLEVQPSLGTALAFKLSYLLCYHNVMAQREKRSVSLPPDLARAVEQAAKAEGTTFSAWLAQTAAHRLKLEAGRQAIAEWERENGPLTEAELADGLARARSSLGRAPAPAAERRSA
jgi:predicted transcriptional regulator